MTVKRPPYALKILARVEDCIPCTDDPALAPEGARECAKAFVATAELAATHARALDKQHTLFLLAKTYISLRDALQDFLDVMEQGASRTRNSRALAQLRFMQEGLTDLDALLKYKKNDAEKDRNIADKIRLGNAFAELRRAILDAMGADDLLRFSPRYSEWNSRCVSDVLEKALTTFRKALPEDSSFWDRGRTLDELKGVLSVDKLSLAEFLQQRCGGTPESGDTLTGQIDVILTETDAKLFRGNDLAETIEVSAQ